MFLRFFAELRDAKVPVSLKEYLALMEAMDREVIGRRTEEFYYLSRAILVKDEKNLDKFDRVFSHVFKGMEYEPAFREVEAALSALGGRPHWGKRSFLSAPDFAPRYPRWDDFQRIRAELDPHGRFANAWVRDVLG